MKTIWRYEINKSVNDVELPVNAKVINVGISDDVISLWAEVDTVNEDYTEIRRFLIFGTGANMDYMDNFNPRYLGTVNKSNKYAFHIYEVDK